MTPGRFFTTIGSFSAQEIVDDPAFRYIPFVCTERNAGFAEQYPIYVSIKPTGIDFRFQGKIKSNAILDPAVPLEERDNYTIDYLFGQTTLLELDISSCAHESILNVFDQSLTLKPYGRPPGSSDCFYRFSDQYATKYNYSSLSVFGLHKINWPGVAWDLEPQESLGKQVFLRRLLLDFLDDFFNSRVFEQARFYKVLKSKIRSCPALWGIYLKADLLSKRKRVEDLPEIPFNRGIYLNAVEQWELFLTREAPKELFAKSIRDKEEERWFGYEDAEVQRGVAGRDFCEIRLAENDKFEERKQEQQKHALQLAVNKLVRNYEVFTATALVVRRMVNERAGQGVMLIGLLLLFGLMFSIRTQKIHEDWFYSLITVGMTGFCIGLYHWVSKTLVRSSFWHTVGKLLIFALAICLCTWLVYEYGPGLSHWQWFTQLIAFAVVAGITLTLYSFTFSSAISLLMPRLLMALCTSWIAIVTGYDYWKRAFFVSFWDALGFSGILLLFTSGFLFFEIRHNTRLEDIFKLFWKVLNVMLPGFILSLSVGMILISVMSKKIITTSDFFSSDVSKKMILPLDSLYHIQEDRKAHIQFLDEEMAEMKRDIHRWRHMVIIGKSNERKIIGDSIRSIESDIHKLKLLKNKLFNKLMKDNDQLDVDTLYAKLKTFNSTDHPRPVRKNNGLRLSREKLAFYTYDFWGNDVIIMVPGFLILMAAFALFSAVFLTLLFDSKPVTEPL